MTILNINLSNQTITKTQLSAKDRELFIGNKTLAAKILYDRMTHGVDPLSEQNIVVITNSVLTGTGAPCSSRFNVSTKGPLTNLLISSNCGGSFGIYLKKAGYCALAIEGKSDHPCYIKINEDQISIENAEDWWGLTTSETQEQIKTKIGKNWGDLVIGPAGENLVRFACLLSERRAVGRGGIGAVFGSKNLKAVVVTGKKKISIVHPLDFKKSVHKWSQHLKKHPVTGEQFPNHGTSVLLNNVNRNSILPTANFKRRKYKYANEISGETMTEKYLVKNEGCRSCPIRCGRVVKVDGVNVKGPEYETIGMFGSNILNSDLQAIFKWNTLMDELGMDTISTGGVLAFAMEATQKGLIKSDLRFGFIDNIRKYIEDIAYRRGLGDDLAKGVLACSKKYGGEEFAMHSKGLEFAAYDPRGSVGLGLGYATANRGGCHLNAGYLVYFEVLSALRIPPKSPKGKAALVIFQQNLMEAVSSYGSCLFTSYALVPKFPIPFFGKIAGYLLFLLSPLIYFIDKYAQSILCFFIPTIHYDRVLSSITGRKITLGVLLKDGARGFTLERMFNLREQEIIDTLPERFLEEVPLKKMLKDYYRKRGWNSVGIPLKSTLKRYQLDTL